MRRDWRQRAPRRGTTGPLAITLIAGLLCACGAGDPAGPDAGTTPPDADGTPPDATVFPACAEIAAPAVTIVAADLPSELDGSLLGAGADLLSPLTCDTIEAPFGIESAGADAAFAITGLDVGVEYVVRLDGDDDLAFYVVTGCSTSTGPAAGECLLYVDAVTSSAEFGRFVAPAADVYVVVDYYDAGDPVDGDFTLEVYRAECSDFDSAACGNATPACLDARCVGCVTDFDCGSPAAPLCNETDHACVAGFGLCTGDDGAENGDDGPAGATLMPSGVTLVGGICNNPLFERDFHRFHVDDSGEHWFVELGWSAAIDLDLVIYDAAGDIVGMSLYEQPEGVELTYLPAGDYYAMVDSYAPTQTSVSTSYAIRATQTGAGSCTSAADCAAEFRNQVYRGDCSAGACRRVDGQGLRGPGQDCDSDSDCGPDSNCSSFFFVADSDDRMVCGNHCSGDVDCAGLGANYVCTTYLEDNFCVQACTSSLHCPALPYSQPQSPPWLRFTCQASTGRCQPP